MKFQVLTCILGTLTLAASCDDVGSSRKGASSPNTVTSIDSQNSVMVSGIARDRGLPQVTYTEEVSLTSIRYRQVPEMGQDTEASNSITISNLGRPTEICGIENTLKSISARVADCQKKNGTKATWSGINYGTSSEADWDLVALISTSKEIWQDQRTKAIWSFVIDSTNWCEASGNVEGETANVNSVDCQKNNVKSVCHGAVIADELADAIEWRLPTRTDYLQAEVDGIRFVLDSNSTDVNFWTATLDSASPLSSKAWIYSQKQGMLTSDELLNSHQVRCLGTPKN